ncbi:MAG: endolytic transglycosylase MltG [Cyclobacteriaceae bacterium]|nr:endolytic transglycosylase MltG [Cyclobacteriaceae bacterium]
MVKPPKKLIFFLLFSMLLISFGFYSYQIVFTPNILVGKEDRLIVIPRDADFKTVQKLLHEGNYVQDLMSFAFLSRMMGYDKKIKPGRFVLHANMTNIQAIRTLRQAKQVPVKITFNNVRLLKDLSDKITVNLGMHPDEFEAAAVKFAMNNTHGFNKDNLMCMFIPNTYEVYYNVSADALLERMYKEYTLFWNEERKKKAESLGLTPVEVSILASIVQAETVKQDEAPTIAGLYINRLKQKMPLQADPTLVFASGDFSLKRVLNEHKEIDSPYNTYKYAGLPPGPINMPRINCLDAVLNYERHDYLFYAASTTRPGYHEFNEEYRSHVNTANKYRKTLNKRNIF